MSCSFCEKDPALHSFRIQEDSNVHTIYYSCISESTDTKVDQIVSHIRGLLEKQKTEFPTKTWSYIMDSRDFVVKWHTLPLTLKLIELIKSYMTTLTEIRIVNFNSWMKNFLKFCIPYMSIDLQKVIVVE